MNTTWDGELMVPYSWVLNNGGGGLSRSHSALTVLLYLSSPSTVGFELSILDQEYALFFIFIFFICLFIFLRVCFND